MIRSRLTVKLTLDQQLAQNYMNPSQKVRVLTEAWTHNSIFCPNCGHEDIDKYPNNQPVADFYCSNCREEYELKSKQNSIGAKIVDGSYRTMIERLQSSNNPNFFLLTYGLASFEVFNFLVIPKHFFVPEIIEKRKPLADTAQRAGWIGCNILLTHIPQDGKIYFVRDKRIEPREKVLQQWKKTLFLREEKEMSAKGWLLDIMRCIEFENELSRLHPENKHIKDKIRQQLQILRDRNYLEFSGRGLYRIQ
jgi:type II restriction enzyme